MSIFTTVKSTGTTAGSIIKAGGNVIKEVSSAIKSVTRSIDTFLGYSVAVTPNTSETAAEIKAFLEAARALNLVAYGLAAGAKELGKMTVTIGDQVIKYSDIKASSKAMEAKAYDMVFATAVA